MNIYVHLVGNHMFNVKFQKIKVKCIELISLYLTIIIIFANAYESNVIAAANNSVIYVFLRDVLNSYKKIQQKPSIQ